MHRPAGWKPYVKPQRTDPFYLSNEWRKIRAERLRMDGYRCTVMTDGVRCSAKASTVHHLVERKQGGTDHYGNLVSTCAACHNKVHGRRG